MDGCFFQQILQQNLAWLLFQHLNILPRRSFIPTQTERPYVPLKFCTRDFSNNPSFKRSDVFMGQSVEILHDLNILTSKHIF